MEGVVIPMLQLHHQVVYLAAAPSGNEPEVLVRDAQFPGVLAALGATFALLAIVRFIGKRIGWDKKFDNVLRVVIAFFGFGGILSFLPLMGILSDLIGVFYTSFAEGSGWGTAGKWGVGVVSLVAAGVGVYMYFTKSTTQNLFIMVLLTLPFYSIPWIREVTLWWINNGAVPLWNGLVNAWDALTKLDNLTKGG
jgi:hypothetical protein